MKKEENKDKEEDKEIFCQLDNMGVTGSFPIDWNMLPNEILSALSNGDFDTELSFDGTDIIYKTVVYFRIVKKFRKNITKKVKYNNIIFGI
mgnify:CR=1 FL=1